MSQKVHPKLFRIGITENWDSRWFDLKKYKEKLEDDFKIRKLIKEKFEKGVVEIYNLLGQKIASSNINNFVKFENEVEYVSQIYIVKVVIDGVPYTKRLYIE